MVGQQLGGQDLGGQGLGGQELGGPDAGRDRRWPVLSRRRPLRSLVRSFALRSALAFVVVGVGLHFVVQDLVESQFRAHAEFHAVFVTEAVLSPRLAGLDTSPAAAVPAAGEVAEVLQRNAIELDEAVYHVVIWDPDDAVALFSDTVAHVGEAPAGYGALLAEARRQGTASVDGPAPYLVTSPPVESTVRTFVALELD